MNAQSNPEPIELANSEPIELAEEMLEIVSGGEGASPDPDG